jgi:hypothetical protein
MSTAAPWAGRHDKGERTMDRVTRRRYFDRLCLLRDAYRELGPDDTTSVITIEAMVERAERLLDQRPSPLIAMLDERDSAN